MLMLIDTREERPEPQPRRDFDWRLWMWAFESVGLFVLASSVAGAVAVVCAFVGVVVVFKALQVRLPGGRR